MKKKESILLPEEKLLEELLKGRMTDPHSILGMHEYADGILIRVFDPEAERVSVRFGDGFQKELPLTRIHPEGLFAVGFPQKEFFPYQVEKHFSNGSVYCTRDPYSFLPTIGEMDLYLFNSGEHHRVYEAMGAHAMRIDGTDGVRFTVWAPNAERVSVVGNFNCWDGRRDMMRLIKRMGFKVITEFYQNIADGTLDVNDIMDRYLEQQKRDNDAHDEIQYRSAENYNFQNPQPDENGGKEDVLIIDQNLKGIDFKLARCCNPIYGDDVFGFVSVTGGIKIHRCDCPNAAELRARFGYRIVKARWAGKSQGTQYPITLRVVGHDDIGIVTNITSIISKEAGINLRSIGIDSNDGLFSGTLTIMVEDTARLEALIKKLRTVKGVKQVTRN